MISLYWQLNFGMIFFGSLSVYFGTKAYKQYKKVTAPNPLRDEVDEFLKKIDPKLRAGQDLTPEETKKMKQLNEKIALDRLKISN